MFRVSTHARVAHLRAVDDDADAHVARVDVGVGQEVFDKTLDLGKVRLGDAGGGVNDDDQVGSGEGASCEMKPKD